MPSVRRSTFDQLATRVLTGEASAGEAARLRGLLENEKFRARFAHLQRCWDAARPSPAGGFAAGPALKRLRTALAGEKAAGPKVRSKPPRRRDGTA